MTQLVTESNTANGNTQQDAPDREAIRQEWLAMREDFHDLLQEVPDEAWTRKGTSTDWTVKALFGHLLDEMENLPEMVEHAASGRDFLNLPPIIGRRLNYLYTRWKSRKETPKSIAEKYDVYFEEALATLDSIDDDQWHKGANFFGEGHWTVEFIFHNVPRHFEEHAAQIRGALN